MEQRLRPLRVPHESALEPMRVSVEGLVYRLERRLNTTPSVTDRGSVARCCRIRKRWSSRRARGTVAKSNNVVTVHGTAGAKR